MIDYTKILLTNIDVNHLINHPALDFKTVVSESTGEYSPKRIAKYYFCKITVYDNGIVLFSGSIHKMWNEITGVNAPNYKKVKRYTGFNGNQFTIDNILEARNHLTELFYCVPEQMLFQNIEFGVNTNPLFAARQYLKGLLYHNNLLFEYRFNGNLAQAPHQRYILKIYNKSDQYGMDYSVLRIELKIIKTEELKTTGIRTFADINVHTINMASELLLKRFGEVMHYDYTIDQSKLSNTLKRLIKSYSNPRFWIDEVEPRRRDRHKKRLKEITRKYSENLYLQIRQNIIEKCVIINRGTKPVKCVTNNTSNIGLNITLLDNRKCLVTGLPLTHEKNDAKYIRTATINYLRFNDEKIYIELCSLLLSNFNGDHPKYENGMTSHLAKQIRNRCYNPNKIKQTGYNQRQYPNQFRLLI